MNYKWNYQPPTLEQREAARALSREIGISQPYSLSPPEGTWHYNRSRSQALFPSPIE